VVRAYTEISAREPRQFFERALELLAFRRLLVEHLLEHARKVLISRPFWKEARFLVVKGPTHSAASIVLTTGRSNASPGGKIDYVTGFLDEQSTQNWLKTEHCAHWLKVRGYNPAYNEITRHALGNDPEGTLCDVPT
jgi:hypothetical protein